MNGQTDGLCDARKGLPAYQGGMPARQRTLVLGRKPLEQHFGHDQSQDTIAKKLQPFIGRRSPPSPITGARVSQRLMQQVGVRESVPEGVA